MIIKRDTFFYDAHYLIALRIRFLSRSSKLDFLPKRFLVPYSAGEAKKLSTKVLDRSKLRLAIFGYSKTEISEYTGFFGFGIGYPLDSDSVLKVYS